MARDLPTPATWNTHCRRAEPHLSHLDGTYERLGCEVNDLGALIVNSPAKPFPRS